MQIIYGSVVQSSYTVFQNRINLFTENVPFFHDMLRFLERNFLCSVQKPQANIYSGKMRLFTYDILYPS